mmetsp:Transcript_49907/g.117579  ORF Transcript_49907/g.117579 Transcript_49907/m.117579 type:complete len:88 (+) Transcript_49907:2175-2438(+)
MLALDPSSLPALALPFLLELLARDGSLVRSLAPLRASSLQVNFPTDSEPHTTDRVYRHLGCVRLHPRLRLLKRSTLEPHVLTAKGQQ